ncbi:5-dehydro-4-deoxyglucarate dehydratase [Jiangella aurantiaca]|uniref:Probable 5-dehydro-4-deoxyglucarate dehydratase n=1 Tax=Jiangella aurantiaca TaxID=2530373 RepID=A0A4R4ZXC7_9ACTN|nr:5-dehydro-4-deoxyglucarate dehydratase [Jiangella aurantiaca]TDD63911.1 5-dehydro-4-deoxyglucarate dehydratase [Jiangella aurantiaca]
MAYALRELGDSGVLFFPVTPFGDDGGLDLAAFRKHLDDRLPYEPGAVFAGCGTGEFFALGPAEYEQLVAAAVEVVSGRVPVIAGAGYSAALGAEYLRRAEAAGADAVLLFPPPTVIGGPAGFVAHVEAVAASTSLPIVLYQRDQLALTPSTVTELLSVGNVAGLKDGRGDLEAMQKIVLAAGDRWAFFNGLPTAELSARAFGGIGVTGYSSAVFAFLPEVAVAFRRAFAAGDDATCDLLLREFYLPFAELRDRGAGYAVSLIKAGLRLRGSAVGSVRPPLSDPAPEHERTLAELIERGLAAVS